MGVKESQYGPIILKILLLSNIYEPIVDCSFLSKSTKVHFLFVAFNILLFLLLFFVKKNRTKEWTLTQFLSTTYFAYILLFAVLDFLTSSINRTCWTFPVNALCLFVLAFLQQKDVRYDPEKIEIFLVKHLSIYFILHGLINLSDLVRGNALNGIEGLIIPLSGFSMYLALTRRKWILLLSTIFGTGVCIYQHYQTSYTFALLAAIITLFGVRFPPVRIIYTIFWIAYVFSVATSQLLNNLLSYAQKKGHSDTVIRQLFFQIATKEYRSSMIFGKHLMAPINAQVLNAGQIVTLPLHSDALVFLLALGIVGWFIFNSLILTIIWSAWKNQSSALASAAIAGIVTWQFVGIFSSMYSSVDLNLTLLILVFPMLENKQFSPKDNQAIALPIS
jgi:hypothetical protein